jgi:uncharacterized protein (TIGR00106 family)
MSSQKTCKVIAFFSIIPIGQKSTSMAPYVSAAISVLDKIEGLNYEITSMGTVLEADNLDIVFEAVKAAHEAMAGKEIKRIESTLLIDDRKDKIRTMEDKVNSLRRLLK